MYPSDKRNKNEIVRFRPFLIKKTRKEVSKSFKMKHSLLKVAVPASTTVRHESLSVRRRDFRKRENAVKKRVDRPKWFELDMCKPHRSVEVRTKDKLKLRVKGQEKECSDDFPPMMPLLATRAIFTNTLYTYTLGVGEKLEGLVVLLLP